MHSVVEGNVGEGISGEHSLVPSVLLYRAETDKYDGERCLPVHKSSQVLAGPVHNSARQYLVLSQGIDFRI